MHASLKAGLGVLVGLALSGVGVVLLAVFADVSVAVALALLAVADIVIIAVGYLAVRRLASADVSRGESRTGR